MNIRFGIFLRASGIGLLAALAFPAVAQTTYNWTGATSTDYATPTNWSPNRTTPAATDVLLFDNVIADVQGVTADTVGRIVLANNAMTSFTATAVRTFTIAGGAGSDLDIPAGCSFEIRGGFAITLSLNTGAKGVVGGNLLVRNSGNTIPHRVLAVNDGTPGIIFQSGSTFQFAPGGSGAGNPFGTAADDSIRFQSGSTCYQGGTITGPSAGTGSSIAAGTVPVNVVRFDSGSTFYNWTSVIGASGRTYGNYILDNRGSTTNPGGGTPWVVQNDFTVKSTSVGAMNFDGAADPIMRVDGNFTVLGAYNDATAGADTAGPSSVEIKGNVDISNANVVLKQDGSRPFKLTGAAAQSVKLPAGKAFDILVVNNAAGVALASDVAVARTLTLTTGEVATGAFALTAPDGAAAVTRTGGFVNGTLTRTVDAAVAGSRLFPVGTAGKYAGVALNITTAGTGSGPVAVTTTAGDAAGLTNAALAIDRAWSITGAALSGYTAELTFQYDPTDITGGTEAIFVALRNDGTWAAPGTSVVSAANHTVTVSGVNGFSTWTVGETGAINSGVPDWSMY